ncbi:hypothetical protein [Curtobacterium flaccumfaciens]|jgi:hypothetical protein|uniref:hypothetical protein n=1 Tax=Curtobacterium flaccumfaciens TaxID=2035 RepID=UPI0021FF3826|nr:hypothetical protein [Curtobacterium flaccumfaciens]UWD78701.1 hypothetical protein NY058_15015 [Curtobacterium flaccumfaciens]
MQIMKKAAAAAGVAMVMVGLVATPALAEGTASGSFSGANQDFSSKNWTDHQKDKNPTVVSYSSCRVSNGDAVKKISLRLMDQHGVLPDAAVGSSKTTSGCGSVSWSHGASGYTLNDSGFYWKLGTVNGLSNHWLSGSFSAKY